MPDPQTDVPVFVDSAVAFPGFSFVRLNYLSIERDEPDPRWAIETGGQLVPILLLNLAGIVTQPFGAPEFTRFDLIEQLFATIESTEGSTIQVSDVWFPPFLFRGRPIEAGDVYRAGLGLFTDAFRYRNGAIEQRAFLRAAEELGETFRYSPEETTAFRSWHEATLERGAAQFPKDASLALRPREGAR
jgi:hypothetical protein